MRCPTVRIKDDRSPDGYIVINESDLTDKHELFPDDLPPYSQTTTDIPILQQQAPVVVAIPDYWEDMHWKKQVKLAKALGRQDTGRELSGEQAKQFIRLKVAERDGQ